MSNKLAKRRILIVGCPGSGKSTFAKSLARSTRLPLVHIDKLYWQPGWIETERELFRSKIASAVENDQWIMDGNYKETLPLRLSRAQYVVFLDLGRWKCIWNVLLRTLRSYGKVRSDMPEGCPEWFDWAFIKYIWNFPSDQRPILINLLKHYDGEILLLKSFEEARVFLAEFEN